MTLVPECLICFGSFKDPQSLPCGHIFCAECVSLIVRYSRTICKKYGEVTCLACGQVFDPTTEFNTFRPLFSTYFEPILSTIPPGVPLHATSFSDIAIPEVGRTALQDISDDYREVSERLEMVRKQLARVRTAKQQLTQVKLHHDGLRACLGISRKETLRWVIRAIPHYRWTTWISPLLLYLFGFLWVPIVLFFWSLVADFIRGAFLAVFLAMSLTVYHHLFC